jgi:protein SCO1/2
MNALRWIRIATWALVAVLVAATGWVVWRGQTPPPESAAADAAAIGGPFTLVGVDGQPVTEAVFAGKPHAIFFGFTHCPDVCPTTLGEISLMLQDLGAEAKDLQVAFVSIDPERDTPAFLKDYLSAFSDRIIGLTGSEAQVTDMVEKYRVYRRKVPGENGDYTMDHTAAVFLFDRTGAFKGTISYGEPQQDAMAKLKRLVAG